MKKKAVFAIVSALVIIILGAGITALGAFCPIWLENYDDVYDMKFGMPLAFAEQTTDIVFNADYFPRYFLPQYFHESFDTVFLTDMFVFSLLINIAIAAIIYFGIYFIHRAYRKKHPKKQNKRKKSEYVPVFD